MLPMPHERSSWINSSGGDENRDAVWHHQLQERTAINDIERTAVSATRIPSVAEVSVARPQS